MTERGSSGSLDPHILIDRCLTGQLAAPLLRLHQLRAVTLADVWGQEYSKTMPDVEWIQYCGTNRVVALTSNVNIWKVPHEVAAIRSHDALVFAMKANMRTIEYAMILGQNIGRVRNLMKQGGPGFIQITAGTPTTRKLN